MAHETSPYHPGAPIAPWEIPQALHDDGDSTLNDATADIEERRPAEGDTAAHDPLADMPALYDPAALAAAMGVELDQPEEEEDWAV